MHETTTHIYILIYLDVPEGLVDFAPWPKSAFLSKRRFFDFWSVVSSQMFFSRFDASFLLKFEDVSGQG